MLLSGITAFPIESELRLADRWINDWQLMNPDSMFGFVGALVLIPCYKNIKRLEALKKT